MQHHEQHQQMSYRNQQYDSSTTSMNSSSPLSLYASSSSPLSSAMIANPLRQFPSVSSSAAVAYDNNNGAGLEYFISTSSRLSDALLESESLLSAATNESVRLRGVETALNLERSSATERDRLSRVQLDDARRSTSSEIHTLRKEKEALTKTNDQLRALASSQESEMSQQRALHILMESSQSELLQDVARLTSSLSETRLESEQSALALAASNISLVDATNLSSGCFAKLAATEMALAKSNLELSASASNHFAHEVLQQKHAHLGHQHAAATDALETCQRDKAHGEGMHASEQRASNERLQNSDAQNEVYRAQMQDAVREMAAIGEVVQSNMDAHAFDTRAAECEARRVGLIVDELTVANASLFDQAARAEQARRRDFHSARLDRARIGQAVHALRGEHMAMRNECAKLLKKEHDVFDRAAVEMVQEIHKVMQANVERLKESAAYNAKIVAHANEDRNIHVYEMKQQDEKLIHMMHAAATATVAATTALPPPPSMMNHQQQHDYYHQQHQPSTTPSPPQYVHSPHLMIDPRLIPPPITAHPPSRHVEIVNISPSNITEPFDMRSWLQSQSQPHSHTQSSVTVTSPPVYSHQTTSRETVHHHDIAMPSAIDAYALTYPSRISHQSSPSRSTSSTTVSHNYPPPSHHNRDNHHDLSSSQHNDNRQPRAAPPRASQHDQQRGDQQNNQHNQHMQQRHHQQSHQYHQHHPHSNSSHDNRDNNNRHTIAAVPSPHHHYVDPRHRLSSPTAGR